MGSIVNNVNRTWSTVLAVLFAVIAVVGLGMVMFSTFNKLLKGLGYLLMLGGAFSSGLFTTSIIEHDAK